MHATHASSRLAADLRMSVLPQCGGAAGEREGGREGGCPTYGVLIFASFVSRAPARVLDNSEAKKGIATKKRSRSGFITDSSCLPSAHPSPGAPHYTGPATALELQTKVIQRYAKISQLQKSLTRAFSSLKATSSTFTFKTLLSHYAKQTLDPW